MTFQHTNNKDFALKLLDWHGGQDTGVYALGSCLLAFATQQPPNGGQFRPQDGVPDRAVRELEVVHGDDATAQEECKALVAEIERRYSRLPELDAFTFSYLETALWSSTDEFGHDLTERFTLADFDATAFERARGECEIFQRKNQDDFGHLAKKAGHDFWLTRNGHGAGFWDGDWDKEVGDRLTTASKKFKESYVVVGDDGKLYLE